MHILLESSWQGLQLCFRPHFNQRFAHKVMGPKVTVIPISENLGLPFESPKTKWHLGVSPVAKHIIYYKGEGDGFPQDWAVVSLVSSCLPMVRSCTKVPQLHINQLVVWFVQVHANNELFIKLLSPHLEAPTHPSTLEVLRIKKCTPTPSAFVFFTFGLAVESIKELGVCQH